MTEIRLYNTRTRSKEVFTPIDPGNVRMYVCGATVYDRAHLGNARPVVVFDVLYRLLRHVYGADAVTYVRNFTDVDDKINAKAAETGRSIRDITDETIGWYHADMDALGALRPNHEPRCTEYIAPMVAMSLDLIDKGFAYAAEGHVLFSVEAYQQYGNLSGRSVDDMIAGARVEVAPYKKNPMDFVIWKPSTDDQPGWDSPWGRGRPGWHIECSAMARELLGEVFDIHAGGIDLQFPHHENELAQSCCAHGTDRMANWWMHNEMLRVEGEKMSKSLGNFFTVRDLIVEYDKEFAIERIGPAIRLCLLQSKYREKLDFSRHALEQAAAKLGGWANLIYESGIELPTAEEARELLRDSSVISALADDLNTPLAIAEIDSIAKSSRAPLAVPDKLTFPDFDAPEHSQKQLAASLGFLGFNVTELIELHHSRWSERLKTRKLGGDSQTAQLVEALIADRQTARKSKDFARADAIRDGFAAAGVLVKDTPEGAVWELSPDFDPAKLEALK